MDADTEHIGLIRAMLQWLSMTQPEKLPSVRTWLGQALVRMLFVSHVCIGGCAGDSDLRADKFNADGGDSNSDSGENNADSGATDVEAGLTSMGDSATGVDGGENDADGGATDAEAGTDPDEDDPGDSGGGGTQGIPPGQCAEFGNYTVCQNHGDGSRIDNTIPQRLIDEVRAVRTGAIRFAIYNWQLNDAAPWSRQLACELSFAAGRGVSVTGVLGSKAAAAVKDVFRGRGATHCATVTNAGDRYKGLETFTVCADGCISKKRAMHNKYFMFNNKETGIKSVAQLSMNMTLGQAQSRLNDMLIVRDDPALYEGFVAGSNSLEKGAWVEKLGSNALRSWTSGQRANAYFFPTDDVTGSPPDEKPFGDLIDSIPSRATNCVVRMAFGDWSAQDGRVRRALREEKKHCVVYGIVMASTDPARRAALDADFKNIRVVDAHTKTMLIEYQDNGSAKHRVWTGSLNLNDSLFVSDNTALLVLDNNDAGNDKNLYNHYKAWFDTVYKYGTDI